MDCQYSSASVINNWLWNSISLIKPQASKFILIVFLHLPV